MIRRCLRRVEVWQSAPHIHTHSDLHTCWHRNVHPVALSPLSLSPSVCVGGLMGESHLFLSALITSGADMKDCGARDTAGR